MIKIITWNQEKDKLLKSKRGIGFQEIVDAINSSGFIDRIDHPNRERCPKQKIFVVNVDEYVYLVPFVEDDEKIFLKTIYASRKYTKSYLKQTV